MRRSVLIVDDDAHIRDLISLFLEQSGFDIRLCKDGYSAIEEISEKPFDIVILDINMPHMNGLKVLQKMKEQESTKNIPVLMLTGSADESDVKKATLLGVTDYVIKPPKKKDLLARVERVLGGAPQFEQLHFDDSEVDVVGKFEKTVRLHSISKKGMVLKSNFLLPAGDVIKNLQLPVFNQIGVKCQNFKISECNEENEGVFLYHVSFLDLNKKDLDNIAEWITGECFKRKSKGKKAS